MKVIRSRDDKSMVTKRIGNTAYHEPMTYTHMNYPNEMTFQEFSERSLSVPLDDALIVALTDDLLGRLMIFGGSSDT